MKARRIFSTMSLAAAAVALTACGHDEPKTAEADLRPLSVEVAEVERITDRKGIEVRGVVRPARQAAVSSRVMGPVVSLKVRAGDTVGTGQVLLEIQPEASAGQLGQARGALAQAEAALALAERNYRRYEALHAENAASDLELDMARMQYEQALGAVEQARGAVQTASSVADESVVRAPFAALVVETLVEVGDLAAPGRPLVRIESLESQQMWLNVREGDIGRVRIGDPIEVRLDARPELGTIAGEIREISIEINTPGGVHLESGPKLTYYVDFSVQRRRGEAVFRYPIPEHSSGFRLGIIECTFMAALKKIERCRHPGGARSNYSDLFAA